VIQPASDLLDAPPRVPSSENEFESFVQSLPLLAWETDPNGWIYYYNERWYEYTQTTFEEMEGWGWVRVHDPLDLPRMLRVFREAVASGEPWEDEFRLRRGSDGALRWHLSRAVPIRDESGRVVRWFGTNTDIHDQKLALEERERLLQIEQRLRHDAERASREKDEFLAVVSHELRTPLAAVVGWTQALRSTFSDPQLLGPIDRIERNTIALSRLIDDLLDVSRIISGKLEMETSVVDAREALDGALDAVRERFGGTAVGRAALLGRDRGWSMPLLPDD
jgi:PAS domain S-box-containing protein